MGRWLSSLAREGGEQILMEIFVGATCEPAGWCSPSVRPAVSPQRSGPGRRCQEPQDKSLA